VSTGQVYIIGSEGFPYVKIGHTTNVAMRLSQLQTGNPFKLVVLATRPGSWALEQLVHKAYGFQRIRGEWFDFDGADPVAAVDDIIRLAGQWSRETETTKPVRAASARVSGADRDAQLFTLIEAGTGLSLSGMAKETGASKSVVKNRVERMERRGMVFRDSGGMWHTTS